MKTLFITGGAKKIGREIVLKFAREGFDICFTYLKSEKEAMKTKEDVEKLGRKCLILKGDLRDLKTILDWREKFFENFENCDCLINNAAIFNKGNLKELVEEDFDEMIDVNLKAPLFISKYFSEKMKEGIIINIADVAGKVLWRNYLIYSISKAALIALTKVLAKELAPYIRVCAVAPGIIILDESMEKEALKKVILKRKGKPEDIAEACYFLYKNDYITGTVLYIDGGRSVY